MREICVRVSGEEIGNDMIMRRLAKSFASIGTSAKDFETSLHKLAKALGALGKIRP